MAHERMHPIKTRCVNSHRPSGVQPSPWMTVLEVEGWRTLGGLLATLHLLFSQTNSMLA